MARFKEILAAGILRDIRFDSPMHADLYLYDLDHRGINYRCLESERCPDGTVILRMLQQYNDCDLIQVYH